MPLLRNGTVIENDQWSVLNDDGELPERCDHVVVSLARFIHLHDQNETLPGGVVVSPTDNVLALAPHIHQLKFIAIDFPRYTDGRGYSHARLIRKRLRFEGEIRAVGDVREDQVLFMARSGIDSFAFDQLPDAKLTQELVTRYRKNYQPSYPIPAFNADA